MNETAHILLVDDDREIRDLVSRLLERHGFAVLTAKDAREMATTLSRAKPDLLILDVMLPGKDGLQICREVREESHVPILMLTAMGEEADRVVGLEMGADDYLAKPFSFQELLARLRAITRRPAVEPRTVLSAADLELDTVRHEVRRAGRPIELSAKEFALLELLLRKKGAVVTRSMILDRIWDLDYDGGSNLVEVYINYLRRKVDQDFEPKLIQTVRGSGYVLRETV